ncbi:MAG: LLM class flavin-dependent oxidoreductase [Myxococcales bacterium]|nr:LLM class flavin-dependent oxidoreductase [Myxococcales bacterium]HIK84090.1 LLM class flavin-dependent oxidoreductase [Myxococcales bacterium]
MTTFGIYQAGIGWDFGQFRDYVIEAEALGYDAFWTMDNVVLIHPETEEQVPVYETWVLLPALASVTSKIRLGPLVTPCNRRHPALFAKMTTSFDQISHGRLDLGMGPGDDPIYFIPWGMSYPKTSERIAILREEIEVIKRMWTEERASYEGKFYRLDEAVNHPKPVQTPHPPIWIGLVMGKKLMPRLAAEVADGINLYNGSDVAVRELLDTVKRNCDETGRDYDAIPKSRSVNVIFSDQPIANDESSYFRPKDVEVVKKMSLDDQLAEMKVKKYSNFVRLTERFVVGTPDQIAEELSEIKDMGFDQIILGGLETAEDLARFKEEVRPKVG